MLFVLVFAVLSFSLPVIGEVWRHGSDNVVTRSKDEALELVGEAIETVSAQLYERTAEVRAKALWSVTVYSLLSWLMKIVADWVRFLSK